MKILCAILIMASSAIAAEPKIHRGVPFTQPTLDIYVPAEGEEKDKKHYIVVWIHEGDESPDAKIKIRSLVEARMLVVSIDFRSIRETTIKEKARYVATAIRWTYQHAEDYGGFPWGISVAGDSTAAQLAALVCTDETYLKAEGMSLSIVRGCALIDGDTYDVPLRIATDAVPDAEIAKRFGGASDQKQFSPVTHVSREKEIPPFLIVQLTKSEIINEQGKRLYEVLIDAGVRAKTVSAHGEPHGLFSSKEALPLNQSAYRLFGFMESLIKPRTLDTFRGKLNTDVTPVSAEEQFGLWNFIRGSGAQRFCYVLDDGSIVMLYFDGRTTQNFLWGVLSEVDYFNNGTHEKLPLK